MNTVPDMKNCRLALISFKINAKDVLKKQRNGKHRVLLSMKMLHKRAIHMLAGKTRRKAVFACEVTKRKDAHCGSGQYWM